MSKTIYDYSVPVLLGMMSNLSKVLTKGEENAKERNIAPEVFLQSRIAPDMFALPRQVQIATDNAKGCACRLAGIEVPKWADDEKTFADLQARISKTIDLLKSVDRSKFDDADEKTIEMKFGPRELSFSGIDYLNKLAIPNAHFHCSMAYAILRMNGVPVGKLDYLGG
jgi:hypothetical protein